MKELEKWEPDGHELTPEQVRELDEGYVKTKRSDSERKPSSDRGDNRLGEMIEEVNDQFDQVDKILDSGNKEEIDKLWDDSDELH